MVKWFNTFYRLYDGGCLYTYTIIPNNMRMIIQTVCGHTTRFVVRSCWDNQIPVLLCVRFHWAKRRRSNITHQQFTLPQRTHLIFPFRFFCSPIVVALFPSLSVSPRCLSLSFFPQSPAHLELNICNPLCWDICIYLTVNRFVVKFSL